MIPLLHTVHYLQTIIDSKIACLSIIGIQYDYVSFAAITMMIGTKYTENTECYEKTYRIYFLIKRLAPDLIDASYLKYAT
jgi:hypothetical protein